MLPFQLDLHLELLELRWLRGTATANTRQLLQEFGDGIH